MHTNTTLGGACTYLPVYRTERGTSRAHTGTAQLAARTSMCRKCRLGQIHDGEASTRLAASRKTEGSAKIASKDGPELLPVTCGTRSTTLGAPRRLAVPAIKRRWRYPHWLHDLLAMLDPSVRGNRVVPRHSGTPRLPEPRAALFGRRGLVAGSPARAN